MDADLPAEQNSPRSGPHEESRYCLHPLTAWTAHRQDLGGELTELFEDEVAVVAVRLPEGWPLVFHDAPAIVWQELAASGDEGCSIDALAAPWADAAPTAQDLRADLVALMRGWEELGLVVCISPPGLAQ